MDRDPERNHRDLIFYSRVFIIVIIIMIFYVAVIYPRLTR
jgi:hypothetical protein